MEIRRFRKNLRVKRFPGLLLGSTIENPANPFDERASQGVLASCSALAMHTPSLRE